MYELRNLGKTTHLPPSGSAGCRLSWLRDFHSYMEDSMLLIAIWLISLNINCITHTKHYWSINTTVAFLLISVLALTCIRNFEEPNLMQKPPQRILFTCTKSSSMGHRIAPANAWINNAKVKDPDQRASSMQLFAHLISQIERHVHMHTSKSKVISVLVWHTSAWLTSNSPEGGPCSQTLIHNYTAALRTTGSLKIALARYLKSQS